MDVREPSARYAPLRRKTELGELPVDWQVLPLEHFKPFVTSGSRGWAKYYADIGSVFLRITNLSRNRIYPSLGDLRFVAVPPDDTEGIRTALAAGDLLISITADIGIIGFVTNGVDLPAYINQHIALVRFDPAEVDARYLAYFMAGSASQLRFKAMTDAGAKAGMNLSAIRQLIAAFPADRAEQTGIAHSLADADTLIDSLEQLLTKQRQIKQGAMQELLTGKRRLPGFANSWKRLQIKDIAETDPDSLGVNTDPAFCFNYISLESVNRGLLTGFVEHSFGTAPSRARRPLRPSDILVSTVRPNLQSHLLFAQVAGDWVASTGFCVIRCLPHLASPGFVHALVFSADFQHQIDAVLAGSNYPSINSSDVLRLEFAWPPVDEQQAIAQVLTDMDASLTALQARLTKARQLKQALMQVLLTGRIRLVAPGAAAAGASAA